MSGKNKVTEAEKIHRLAECALYLSEKAPTHGQFISWFQAKYDKGRTMANYYWKDAWHELTELRRDEVVHKRTIRITQLEWQYKAACKENDFKSAAVILMNIAKLEGIDVNKHEIDAKVKSDVSIFKIGLDDDGND